MPVLDSTNGGALLSGTSPLGISNFPFTFACWVRRSGDHSTEGRFMNIGNSASDANGHFIQTPGSANSTQIISRYNFTGGNAIIAGALSTNEWTPVIGVFTSQSFRAVYRGSSSNSNSTDIGGFTTGTNSINSSGGRFALGKAASNIARNWLGLIAHAAVWDKALTESERNAFLAGGNPLEIANADLRAYWAEDFFEDGGVWYYEDKSGNDYHLALETNAVRDTGTTPPEIDDPPSTGLAFTVAPSVTARTTNSYTIGGTTNADCDVYAVATLTTATDPDGPQIFAGTDGSDTAAEAANSVTATGGTPFELMLSGLTESSHHIHIVPRRDTA
jgi:hypothetical protein